MDKIEFLKQKIEFNEEIPTKAGNKLENLKKDLAEQEDLEIQIEEVGSNLF